MLCTNLFTFEPIETPECCFGPNQSLKFLIVLSDDDFQQKSCLWVWSKIDLLQQNSRKFPGKLEILSKKQLNWTHRNENADVFILNRLYVRLPKEKIYVPFEQFPARYIKSQLDELGLLLFHLNAEEVKIKRILSNPLIEKPLATTHPGVSAYVKEMGAIEHSCVEIKYDMQPPMIKFPKELFFYEDKWKPIIEGRCKQEKLYDDYTFEYVQPCFMEEEFIAFLRSCEINVPVYDISTRKFELQYEIFYYVTEICRSPSPQKSTEEKTK